MKRPFYIQCGIGPKQHPARIEQKQIRSLDLRPQQPINGRRLSSGDPAENIGDRGGAAEGGAAPGGHIELAKTMKEITAADLPQLRGDAIAQACQRSPGAQAAVQSDLRVADGEQHPQ
jgi:hypothetical protein